MKRKITSITLCLLFAIQVILTTLSLGNVSVDAAKTIKASSNISRTIAETIKTSLLYNNTGPSGAISSVVTYTDGISVIQYKNSSAQTVLAAGIDPKAMIKLALCYCYETNIPGDTLYILNSSTSWEEGLFSDAARNNATSAMNNIQVKSLPIAASQSVLSSITNYDASFSGNFLQVDENGNTTHTNKTITLDYIASELVNRGLMGKSKDDAYVRAYAQSFCDVFTILSAKGYSNESIIGILVNLQHESGINPFAKEKQSQISSYNNWTLINDRYLPKLDASFVYTDGGKGGLGLAQWTGERATDYQTWLLSLQKNGLAEYNSKELDIYMVDNGKDFREAFAENPDVRIFAIPCQNYQLKCSDKFGEVYSSFTNHIIQGDAVLQSLYIDVEHDVNSSTWCGHHAGLMIADESCTVANPLITNGYVEEGGSVSWEEFKSCTDAKEASYLWTICWERCQNRNGAAISRWNKSGPAFAEMTDGLFAEGLNFTMGSSLTASGTQAFANNVTTLASTGSWTPSQLHALAAQTEANIELTWLAEAQRHSLSTDELASLAQWEMFNAKNTTEYYIVDFIRQVVVFIGLIFIVWATFFYLCYWFDKVNNFIPYSTLYIISFGHFVLADNETNVTYGTSQSSGVKQLNHRAVIGRCLVAMAFGVLVVSGTLFTLLYKIVMLLKTFMV